MRDAIPGIPNLWAPDISFFNGLYHVYYAGSLLGSQRSVIGLATSPTLDPADPAYAWTDRGMVLESRRGGDFNAIDPNILVGPRGRVWLTYGSYWGGIKQREINPATGMFLAPGGRRFDVAARPEASDHSIEGASLLYHDRFFYLFLSIDRCCERRLADDDYKEIVGRSKSPNGPFTDSHGVPLMQGGGDLLLKGNPDWLAPGGATVFNDPASGRTLLVFHALDTTHRAEPTLWLKHVSWVAGWPVLD